jgi:hypothetical protein
VNVIAPKLIAGATTEELTVIAEVARTWLTVGSSTDAEQVIVVPVIVTVPEEVTEGATTVAVTPATGIVTVAVPDTVSAGAVTSEVTVIASTGRIVARLASTTEQATSITSTERVRLLVTVGVTTEQATKQFGGVTVATPETVTVGATTLPVQVIAAGVRLLAPRTMLGATTEQETAIASAVRVVAGLANAN